MAGAEESWRRNVGGDWKRERRQLGVSVFVDNVSKRVPQMALKELFQSYRAVLDTYIAYSNLKRKTMKTTFAFVRFRNWDEAKRDVKSGYGRQIDGHILSGNCLLVENPKSFFSSPCDSATTSDCRPRHHQRSTRRLTTRKTRPTSLRLSPPFAVNQLRKCHRKISPIVQVFTIFVPIPSSVDLTAIAGPRSVSIIIQPISFPPIVIFSVCHWEGKLVEFGNRINGRWEWNIDIRRMLYSWEFSLWDDFILTLDEAVQSSTGKDKVRWLGSPSGTYTHKSFCSNAVYDEEVRDNFWKMVWSNLATPKVEILV
ncbi:hypothetical protein F3Y22_tig00111542pilonHSYRG00126 [Hibiscus syriacus]|uniref:RRM domain-containing protein n=1 Tax=Hibiscus syriacus TaxID=106335 RepID=A0A6A2XNL9_HIBSY|nr:hypothetical protein F3Y22_tig00111542pilonHSYRG00126 [Hibiscus syriacus]